MSSRSYHHGDLKTALIEAANLLLNEKGVDALSLRTLASHVGVSHMAPYAHFKNKTELFQAIAAKGFRALSRRMEQVDQSLPPNELILDYGTQYIEFAVANAPLYRLMLTQTQVKGPQASEQGASHMSQELIDASKRPYTLLVSAFSRLPKEAASNLDDDTFQNVRAQGAWSLVHGIASLLIDGHLTVPKGMSIKAFLAVASLQSIKTF